MEMKVLILQNSHNEGDKLTRRTKTQRDLII